MEIISAQLFEPYANLLGRGFLSFQTSNLVGTFVDSVRCIPISIGVFLVPCPRVRGASFLDSYLKVQKQVLPTGVGNISSHFRKEHPYVFGDETTCDSVIKE